MQNIVVLRTGFPELYQGMRPRTRGCDPLLECKAKKRGPKKRKRKKDKEIQEKEEQIHKQEEQIREKDCIIEELKRELGKK